MEDLLSRIEELRGGEVRKLVDERMSQFEEAGRESDDSVFGELCYCIMTANFNAERSMKMQDSIGSGFCTLSESGLVEKLKEMGHRFPSARAKYITEARACRKEMKKVLSNQDQLAMRDWLADNVKGIGYKEASHFLRNIGFKDLAIIDFHIVDLLVKHRVIERPKTLTRKKYLEIEGALRKIGEKAGLNLAELDLYLWYIETGKILK